MRSLAVVIALAAPAAADTAEDARHAIWLAQQGRCEEALHLAGEIGQRDPAVYRRTLVDQTDLVGCMVTTTPTEVHVVPPVRDCHSGLYLEPSLFIGGPDTQLLHRIAVGAIFRNCTSDGFDRTNARLGATLMIAGHDFIEGGGAFGIESAIDHPIADKIRLGGRVGYESQNGHALFTFGARVHYDDILFGGIDGYVSTNNFVDGNPATGYGVMIGGGVEGKAGAVIGGTEAVVGGVLLLFLIAAFANSGG